MQMSKTYESTNKYDRARQARKDARECHAAGYPGFAQVNSEIASMLDPWRDHDDQDPS